MDARPCCCALLHECHVLLLLWLHYTALRLPYVWLCNGQALETRTVTQGDQLRWCTVAAVRHMAWRMDHVRLCICLAAVLTAVVASASASAVLCPPLLFSDGRSASRDAHVGGEAEGVGATTTARRASAQHKDGGGRRGGHGGRPPRRLGADDWQVKGGREGEMREGNSGAAPAVGQGKRAIPGNLWDGAFGQPLSSGQKYQETQRLCIFAGEHTYLQGAALSKANSRWACAVMRQGHGK